MTNQLKMLIPLGVCLVVSPLCPSFDSIASNQNEPQFSGHVQEIIADSSTWEKGAHVFREISRYDKSGHVVELGFTFLKVTDDGLQQIGEERMGKWFYDKQGRHIKTTYTLPDDSMDMVITHSYDDRGNQIDHTSFDKNGNITLRFVFSYDADGNQIGVQSFNGKSQLFKRIVNEYDGAHRLTSAVGFNGDGSVEYRFTEKYESEGMSKVTLRYNGSGDLEEKVVSTYLESGLLAGEARLTGDGNISSKKKYSYEFDEKGNWTKQTSTQLATNAPGASPEPSHITRRAIKYY